MGMWNAQPRSSLYLELRSTFVALPSARGPKFIANVLTHPVLAEAEDCERGYARCGVRGCVRCEVHHRCRNTRGSIHGHAMSVCFGDGVELDRAEHAVGGGVDRRQRVVRPVIVEAMSSRACTSDDSARRARKARSCACATVAINSSEGGFMLWAF